MYVIASVEHIPKKLIGMALDWITKHSGALRPGSSNLDN